MHVQRTLFIDKRLIFSFSSPQVLGPGLGRLINVTPIILASWITNGGKLNTQNDAFSVLTLVLPRGSSLDIRDMKRGVKVTKG